MLGFAFDIILSDIIIKYESSKVDIAIGGKLYATVQQYLMIVKYFFHYSVIRYIQVD